MIKQALDDQQIPPGTLTLGTDNGSAFTARSTRPAISVLGVTHRRGGYRDPKSQAFSSQWSCWRCSVGDAELSPGPC